MAELETPERAEQAKHSSREWSHHQWKEFRGRNTSGRQKWLPGVNRDTKLIGWEGILRIICFQLPCNEQGHHKLTKSSNIWGNEQA